MGPRAPDWLFYRIVPANLFLPVALTGLFLYQVSLAEFRGWTMASMASAFIGFAVARMSISLMIGPLIDRWSATAIFPVVLMPVAAGLTTLKMDEGVWVLYAYLIGAGISQGLAGPIMTAVWAETYGIASLGAIKGTVATLGVFGTALGPLLLGAALEAGISFETVISVCIGAALACTV